MFYFQEEQESRFVIKICIFISKTIGIHELHTMFALNLYIVSYCTFTSLVTIQKRVKFLIVTLFIKNTPYIQFFFIVIMCAV
jgi:hypothetical protein